MTTSFGQCRGRIEVEAESVAYLITASHGLDSSAYTFPYVAGWAGSVDSVQPETVVRATGERVLAAARVILAATEHIGVAVTAASQTQLKAQNLDAAADLRADVDRGTQQSAALLTTALHTDRAAEQLPTSPSGPTHSSGPTAAASPSSERLIQVHESPSPSTPGGWPPTSPDAHRAVALLTARRVDAAAVLDSGLGYAPRGWTHLTDHLRTAGVSDQELLATGLVLVSGRGTLIDRFRDRIIFPVHDLGGHPVALLGRAVDRAATDRTGNPVPKYLNSPDTAIYRKGEVLYGLHEAQRALHKGAIAVLVEGPMDVLAVNRTPRPHNNIWVGTRPEFRRGRTVRHRPHGSPGRAARPCRRWRSRRLAGCGRVR